MNQKTIKKLLIIITIMVITFILSSLIKKNNNRFVDTVKYDKKTYVLLEYNTDIFTYNHNSNNFYEEDIIHPISNNKWNVVYFNGDLFVLDKQVKKATKYYKDDKNYNWYIVFDNGDNEIKKTIFISDNELNYLYNMEHEQKSTTIIFDDIDMFASIVKISNDNLVQAIITLAQVDGTWYYKTEVMTDDDREYVVRITDSLNKKINKLM